MVYKVIQVGGEEIYLAGNALCLNPDLLILQGQEMIQVFPFPFVSVKDGSHLRPFDGSSLAIIEKPLQNKIREPKAGRYGMMEKAGGITDKDPCQRKALLFRPQELLYRP